MEEDQTKRDQPARQRRIIIIGHRYFLNSFQLGLYNALGRRFHVKAIFVDDGWPTRADEIPEYREYDACIWYVHFRKLMQRPVFQWGDFPGLRVMLDEDTWLNYRPGVMQSEVLGKYPEIFHRHGFHVLLSTGKHLSERLNSDGIPTSWWPKAYDPNSLYDLDLERQGICYYGAVYIPRRIMLERVRRANIGFTQFRCKFKELNQLLNKHLGCLICNMTWTHLGGRQVGRMIESHYLYRWFPTLGAKVSMGTDVMLKNFEAAGAGCAPIADWIDEMEDLGFEDGKTMVAYSSFEELIEKLHYYMRRPETLKEIGLRAMELVRERHTWDDRVDQMDRLFANMHV